MFLLLALRFLLALPCILPTKPCYASTLCFNRIMPISFVRSFVRSHRLALAHLIFSIMFTAILLSLRFDLVLHSASFKILKPCEARGEKIKREETCSDLTSPCILLREGSKKKCFKLFGSSSLYLQSGWERGTYFLFYKLGWEPVPSYM